MNKTRLPVALWMSGVLLALLMIACCPAPVAKRAPARESAAEAKASLQAEETLQPTALQGGQPERVEKTGAVLSSPPPAGAGDLRIYSFEPLSGRLSVVSTVEVPAGAEREAALEALLAAVNARLSGKWVEKAGVRQEKRGDILVLDLVDSRKKSGPGSWYDEFQGSAGGSATQAFLVATFLQQDYGGAWFDGVKFLLNGEPMSEMDHVNLSPTFLRNGMLANYVPTPLVTSDEPAVEPSEEQIESFLRKRLAVGPEVSLILVRPKTAHGDDMAVFFVSASDRLARRGVVRIGRRQLELLFYERDPCRCPALKAEPLLLVRGEGEFVVTRFTPVSGSCVAQEVVSIISVESNGELKEVWRGTTFEASGARSTVAEIGFSDVDGDGDLEITRRGKVIDCGDECLCRDGPVLETFAVVYDWDAGGRAFVRVKEREATKSETAEGESGGVEPE